ncbi:MAG: lipopolysaccharide biosynthesis protein [Longibaculum sp.]
MDIKTGVKKVFYSVGANLVTLFGSTLIVAVVPKIIGVTEYGYWQLYLFYASYVGFFQFGWSDGMYLRYGGYYYEKLDKKVIGTQFWYLSFFEIILMGISFLALSFIALPFDKRYILSFTLLLLPIVIPKAFLTYLLQTTSRIREYSLITITESLLYVTITLVMIFFNVSDYKYIIFADLFAKIISLFLAVYFCKDIVFVKLDKVINSIKESYSNINIGIKLMLANIASMLILGIVKLAIENHWSIEVFGKVSLSISVSNMIVVFITAIGVVIFPIIKRIDSDQANNLYKTIRDILMICMFLALLLFFPLSFIMRLWLPQYIESLQYLAILFPICIFEGKMSLIVLTYLKAYRKEKNILIINIISVCICLLFTIFGVYIFNNLNLVIINIVVVFGIRSTISEKYLSSLLDLNLSKDIFLEVIMCIVFILISCNTTWFLGMIYYSFFCMVYCFIKRKNIINYLKKIKEKNVSC